MSEPVDIADDVYMRLKAHIRKGESVSDALDRLLDIVETPEII